MTTSPLVSVLITTYNRSNLLQRSLGRVLSQDFHDLEVVVIDDCSTDDTPEIMKNFPDPRVRYIRNEQNVGGKLGDRAHIRRFVHELARGKYHVYVCDDDFWLASDLLSRQVQAYQDYPDTVMVVGGQLSYFLYRPEDDVPDIRPDNLGEFLDEKFKSRDRHANFQPGVFPQFHMKSDEYLEHFSEFPTGCNIIGGAILYDREKFILSGALDTAKGSQWQAGFELVMGPGCYGDVIYFDEPCIVSEIRQENASFGRTQLAHYLDSIFSVELAFSTPLRHAKSGKRKAFLKRIKRRTIANISRAYMGNTLHIKRGGTLGLCTEENISKPVTYKHVLTAFLRNRVPLTWTDAKCMALTALSQDQMKRWDEYRTKRDAARS